MSFRFEKSGATNYFRIRKESCKKIAHSGGVAMLSRECMLQQGLASVCEASPWTGYRTSQGDSKLHIILWVFFYEKSCQNIWWFQFF
jgi:hypothetical protein